jgi:hypothetical protein
MTETPSGCRVRIECFSGDGVGEPNELSPAPCHIRATSTQDFTVWGGPPADWMDRLTCADSNNASLRLLGDRIAKVRVAGSNPVFRSKNSWPELG